MNKRGRPSNSTKFMPDGWYMQRVGSSKWWYCSPSKRYKSFRAAKEAWEMKGMKVVKKPVKVMIVNPAIHDKSKDNDEEDEKPDKMNETETVVSSDNKTSVCQACYETGHDALNCTLFTVLLNKDEENLLKVDHSIMRNESHIQHQYKPNLQHNDVDHNNQKDETEESQQKNLSKSELSKLKNNIKKHDEGRVESKNEIQEEEEEDEEDHEYILVEENGENVNKMGKKVDPEKIMDYQQRKSLWVQREEEWMDRENQHMNLILTKQEYLYKQRRRLREMEVVWLEQLEKCRNV